MARLKRITNKIFGNTASTTGTPDTGAEIGQFGSAKAGTYNATADVETIQALPAYEQGWIGAVIPDQQYPTLPEMTGVNKVLSYQTGYLMQEGIPEWDNGTTYYKNSIVKYAEVTTTQTATASIGASTGITSASVNKNTFVSQINVDGNYTFTYNGTSWLYNNIVTDLSIYGITYEGTPAENDAITVTLTTTQTAERASAYISLTDNNINHNPLTDTDNWTVWEIGDYANRSLSNLLPAGQAKFDQKASTSLNNLSSVGQAILDRKVEVEALLAQNGYAKFTWKEGNKTSKLIVQWGLISTVASSAPRTVSFNTVFNSVLNVSYMTIYSAIPEKGDSVANVSNSSFKAYRLQPLYWFALGT